MRASVFVIFLSIVLFIYFVVNFYIFRRGWQALSGAGTYRTIFLIGFLILVLSYPLGRFAEHFSRNGFTEFLVFLGSIYLGIMVYALFLVLIIDLLRLVNHFTGFFPNFIRQNGQKSAEFATLFVVVVTVLIVIAGYVNTLFPRIRTLELTVPKTAGNLSALNVVVASDIHLGTIIRNGQLEGIIERINSLDPDIVLLPGDIVDEDVGPLVDQNMSATLQKIKSRLGVYASTGNHEYFGGVERAVAYIEKGNIKVLQDTLVKVADAFYIIGRKDRMAERMGSGRKSLAEIMDGVDHQYPLILMDHEPIGLDEAGKNGIDLQLSGHTHHGQLFPFNYITKAVYELSWGYLRKESTNYYVSCGVGTWGPPVRTNSVPEIVRIILRFKEKEREMIE
jgi:predicted MPP superfamily phosphohydrolase